MKIVIKVGGSIVCPDGKPNVPFLKKFADGVRKIKKQGHEVHIVGGGGMLCRNYVSAAKEFGLEDTALDVIGMKSGRFNALAIIAALNDIAYPVVPENFDDIGKALSSGKVLVLGGLLPGQTHDAVAVQLAGYINADLVIKGTNVNGIYDKDPRKDKDAKHLDRITHEKLFEIASHDTFVAGTSSIIDPQAALLLRRSDIRAIVLNIDDIDNLMKAVNGKDFTGTEING